MDAAPKLLLHDMKYFFHFEDRTNIICICLFSFDNEIKVLNPRTFSVNSIPLTNRVKANLALNVFPLS